MLLKYICFFPLLLSDVISIKLSDLNIPPQHVMYVFNNFDKIAKTCAENVECPYRDIVGVKACWGYENDCIANISYEVKPTCPGDHRGWVKTKQAQYETFYTQADFGYVKEQIQELMVMCEASVPDDTSLECSKYLRFCRGRNMVLNFTGLVGRGDNLRYKMDILGPGQIGGHCHFHSKRLIDEAEHMSALQSWAPELVHFVQTPQRPTVDGTCDVVVEKPTYIMKLDATVNMYHHFCDFFNLYASLHVNSTHPSTFSKDNHILVWETFTYESLFKDAFKAFTINPVWDLKHFRGKTVCFKNVVFPLLPRMIFGLYYNTPLTCTELGTTCSIYRNKNVKPVECLTHLHNYHLFDRNNTTLYLLDALGSRKLPLALQIYGCENSGLFHAFSKHMLHSLDIILRPRTDDRVRVTLLSRGTTYRGILNEQEIMDALNKMKGLEVQRVVYDKTVPFVKQLEITHNSDVFISMHGAGLTHLLFLPDWAAVFEVYNCEDPNCYKDLSRLRGLKYVTWEDKAKLVQQDQGHGPGGASHAKFTNYSFDVKEFLRLVSKCVEHVRQRKDFKEFVQKTIEKSQHEEL